MNDNLKRKQKSKKRNCFTPHTNWSIRRRHFSAMLRTSQLVTPKRNGKLRSGAKLNIGVLRRPHPTKAIALKTGIEISKEAGLSRVSAKWYLCYLKEGLEPEEALKKAQDSLQKHSQGRGEKQRRSACKRSMLPRNPDLSLWRRKSQVDQG